MDKKTILAFREMRLFYADQRAKIQELIQQTRVSRSAEDIADCAYAMKEYLKLVEELRKLVNQAIAISEQMACAIWIQSENGDPIRTEFVTASPRIKMAAVIPHRKKNPEEYAQLMAFLEVPSELWDVGDGDDDHAPIDLHWPGMVELFTKRSEAGLPLPPGIDPARTIPQYHLTCRGRKAVDADLPK